MDIEFDTPWWAPVLFVVTTIAVGYFLIVKPMTTFPVQLSASSQKMNASLDIQITRNWHGKAVSGRGELTVTYPGGRRLQLPGRIDVPEKGFELSKGIVFNLEGPNPPVYQLHFVSAGTATNEFFCSRCAIHSLLGGVPANGELAFWHAKI